MNKRNILQSLIASFLILSSFFIVGPSLGATCQSTYGTAGEPVDTDASLCGTLTPYASTTTLGSTACASPVGGGVINVATNGTDNFAAAGSGSICNNSGQCTPFLYTGKTASSFTGVTNGTQGQIPACSIAYPPNSRVYAKDTANVADTRWNVVKSAVQAAQKYDGPVLAGNQLPAAGTVGQKAVVTGTDGSSCTSTGGSVVLKCIDNGSAWVPYFTGNTSAALATLLSDENGTGGGFVRATSPDLTTPALTGVTDGFVTTTTSGGRAVMSSSATSTGYSNGYRGSGFASLKALVDQHATDGSPTARAVIDSTLSWGSAVTVPATLTLEKYGSGKITCTDATAGQIDVRGGILATGELFDKTTCADGGVAAVTFANNTTIPEVSPLWWGAVGDDSTPSAAAIQRAVDALPATGGTVVLPVGTFRIDAPITLKDGVTLRGASMLKTILKNYANTDALYAITPAADHIHLQDFEITDGLGIATRTAGHGIDFVGTGNATQHVTIDRVYVLGHEDGIHIAVGAYISIRNTRVVSTEVDCYSVTGTSSVQIYFETTGAVACGGIGYRVEDTNYSTFNSTFSDNPTGDNYYLLRGTTATFNSTSAEQGHGNGYHIHATDAVSMNAVDVSDSAVVKTMLDGIKLEGARWVTIDSPYIALVTSYCINALDSVSPARTLTDVTLSAPRYDTCTAGTVSDTTHKITVVSRGGKMGINTDAPGQALEVNGSFLVKDQTGATTGQLTISKSGANSLIQETNNGNLVLRAFQLDWKKYSDGTALGRWDETGNLGVNGSTTTYAITANGNAARTFGMVRHTTANTAGNNLTVQAGGATSGATDKAGGTLILAPGLSTGAGTGQVKIQAELGTAAATSDNTLVDSAVINVGSFDLGGANGQLTSIKQNTVLHTIVAGATDTITGLLPAGSLTFGVTCRVTTAVTGPATSFDIGYTGQADAFCNDVPIGLGTTCSLGTNAGTGIGLPKYTLGATAGDVLLTGNGANFTGGVVRCTAHYLMLTPATS